MARQATARSEVGRAADRAVVAVIASATGRTVTAGADHVIAIVGTGGVVGNASVRRSVREIGSASVRKNSEKRTSEIGNVVTAAVTGVAALVTGTVETLGEVAAVMIGTPALGRRTVTVIRGATSETSVTRSVLPLPRT